jgi:hypothetical protein
MNELKTGHLPASLREALAQADRLKKEHDAKYGPPPPMTPEEQDRFETRFRNFNRTRLAK